MDSFFSPGLGPRPKNKLISFPYDVEINAVDHSCSHVKEDTGKLCEPETKTQKYIKITVVDQNWLMWEWRNSRGRRGRWGRARRSAGIVSFQGLLKAPHQRASCTNRQSSCTGQIYRRHQETQGSKYWAQAWLVDAVTQNCGALQHKSQHINKELKDSHPKMPKSLTLK